MKITKKTVIFATAVAGVFIGFFIDKKNNICSFAQKQEPRGSLVSVRSPLTVHNETGAKVNAAFYTKKLKRRGSVTRVHGEKMDLSRKPCCKYLAVARNVNELGESITKCTPARINIKRTRCATLKSQGHELVLTPTASDHKH